MSTSNTPPPQNAQEEEQLQGPRPQEANAAPAAPDETPKLSLLERIVSEDAISQRDQIIVKRAEFTYLQGLARMFVTSQCFTDIDKAENGDWLSMEASIARAMVKIELGRGMGFTPAESMTGIDMIKGRVAVGAQLRAARMQDAGYTWPQMVLTDKGCWMPLFYQGQPMMAPKVGDDGQLVTDAQGNLVMTQVIVKFTEADAQLAGLLEKKGSMYRKDPSSMYYARAVTRAQRRYAPNVLKARVLDTYEAYDADEESQAPEKVIARTTPPDNDPRWLQTGSTKAAEQVAAEKIAAATAAKADKPVEKEQPKEPLSPVVAAAITGHLDKQEAALDKLDKPATVSPEMEAWLKLPMLRFKKWSDVGPSNEEQMDARLGPKVEIGGIIFARTDPSDTWTREPGQRPPAPVFGRPQK